MSGFHPRDFVIAVALGVAVTSVVAFDAVFGPDESQQVLGPDGKPRRGGLLSANTIYSRRTAEDRDEWIQDYGGSPISEQSVTEGLAWLARHQGQNGSWQSQYLGNGAESLCEDDGKCKSPGGRFSMATTGLSLLAFQAGGHYYFNDQKYSGVVKRGLDWLVKNQREDGGLYGADRAGRNGQFMYEHGIATFALAEACALSRSFQRDVEGDYQQALERAVKFIVEGQHSDGGWRYSPNKYEGGDTSVSGWQVLALKTAKEAGFKLNDNLIDGIRKFFKGCETGENGRTGYVPGTILSDATTGVGMLVHQFFLDQQESDLINKAAPYLADLAEEKWKGGRGTDYYLWYNCTLAMFQAGQHAHKEEWNRWNNVIRDRLIALQRGQDAGCERGSWDPADGHDRSGGRVYSTALAVLTLEVYYRFAQ